VSTRRLNIGGDQDIPSFTICLGLSNERYDSLGDGANDGIQDQLVLSNPKDMGRV